ncbi:hypothetical protein ILUMI_24531 [Ignelater luminosus]|uniref:Uncharacterized protein n=1 Tax=Ignelater luminosus TaxID=2038154 RepID=A0A8K0C914_IGNLU|nr:hypothetical protein ILUMI_24531 [Ignelater luminosus]
MAFLKCLFLLSFLGVVLADEPPAVHLQIDNEKLTELLKGDPKILSFLERIRSGDKLVTAEVNDFTDKLLVNINGMIKNSGLEPIPMPGFEGRFPLGRVELDDGWLEGISSLIRTGDVLLSYEFPTLRLNLQAGLGRLEFDYHYAAKLLGVGPSGRMEGKSEGSRITIILSVNLTNLQIKMDKFDLGSIGKITLRFRGSITGNIINILTGVIIPLVKPILELILERIFKGGLLSIIDLCNDVKDQQPVRELHKISSGRVEESPVFMSFLSELQKEQGDTEAMKRELDIRRYIKKLGPNKNRRKNLQYFHFIGKKILAVKIVSGKMYYWKNGLEKWFGKNDPLRQVPQTISEHYVRKKCADPDYAVVKSLGRFTSVFSENQEAELAAYLHKMEAQLFGLIINELRRLAFQLAKWNNLPHPFKDEAAGLD